jgi:hypothetical protein
VNSILKKISHFEKEPTLVYEMRQLYLPLVTVLLALTSCISAAKQSKSPKNAILLSNVKSLTLRADAKTAHRRVPAIPQYALRSLFTQPSISLPGPET